MRIERKQAGATPFNKVSPGQVFQQHDYIYMKIAGESPNAVGLVNGKTFNFPDNDVVYVLDKAVLTIEG